MTPVRRRISAWLACAALVGTSAVARADAPTEGGSIALARQISQPHTFAQVGLGLLTIPQANVCLSFDSCTKGDTALLVDLWQMYRANAAFAIGAGASLALKPTTDRPSGAPIARDHTRSYFLVEAQARYYPLHLERAEVWLGVSAGGVVLSDRYAIAGANDESGPAIIGPKASTVRTEGLAAGILVGGQWTLTPSWSAGLSVRYSRWYLPKTPARTVFGDPATLTGQQGAVYFGLALTYRIDL